MKVGLGNRGMRVEVAREYANERKEWRALVDMLMSGFHAAISAKSKEILHRKGDSSGT